MNRRILTIILTIWTIATYSQNKTYFISPQGNDSSSGLSIKDAWKTIEKVNKKTFMPGDKILFESGATWHGQLRPKGSGSQNNPILLSSYGGEERPTINLGEAEGAGVRLMNQSWWIIDNIEVTSGADPKYGIGRQGIAVVVEGSNKKGGNVVIRNCYIHDIWGQLGGPSLYCGYSSAAIISQIQGDSPGASLDNILVEHNRIERIDKCGIIIRFARNNIHVRYNDIDNLGGDGIFLQGCYRGMIEYNVVKRSCLRSGYMGLEDDKDWWPHTAAIWLHSAEESIIQYNEVYDTGRQPRNGDGFAFDFDFFCVRCVVQYNYSKNNQGGFLLIMGDTSDNVARYNISENDKTHLVQMQCRMDGRNMICNNVFYIDHGMSDLEYFGNVDDVSVLGAAFTNNIFYAAAQSHFRVEYATGEPESRTYNSSDKYKFPGKPGQHFYRNCYFGPWKDGLPNDPAKLIANPLFMAPGTGDGLKGLKGYQLQLNSPCINAGVVLPMAGLQDLFGNHLNDALPDMGAYEQIGSGASIKK